MKGENCKMITVSPIDILNGETKLYTEVFGAADGIKLGTDYDGVFYDIFDRYCMNPSCNCNDVYLQFLRFSRDGETGFNVSLSLKSKKYKILETFRMSDVEAEKIIKHSLKDSNEAIQLFQKRYTEMKNAGREALKGIVRMDEPRVKRVSRNETCTCGSGKKYKNCCGS